MILGFQNGKQTVANPLSDFRGHGIADGMITQAVDAVGLTFVEMPRSCPVLGKSLDALNLVRSEAAHPPVWEPDIVPGPISPGVTCGLGVNAMRNAFHERAVDRISNDRLKDGGRFLSILSVLLKIPVAAFGLKKYFAGTA